MAIRRYPYRMHHTWLTGMQVGQLMPVFCQEVTPGDTWSGRSGFIFRLDPIDRPAFVALRLHVHFFFVPHRLTWTDFEDVITGVSAAAWPTVAINSTSHDWTQTWSLIKALGIGALSASTRSFNALPIRAYNLVWNEFFRDQKEQSEVALDQLSTNYVNFPASDYFAGVRTEIQQGSEETVDVSGGTLSITAWRDALHRQRFRERRSQFGERYTDYLAAMGVNAPDSRLDRPEHVARGACTLGVSEVLATATSASENTGAYRGHGLAMCRVRFPKRRFVENGTLIGVCFARGRHQIQGRTDRIFLTSGKDDLFQQELARDTQVGVDQREIVTDLSTSTVYYQRRDEWLRTPRDTIAGTMQDTDKHSWHGAKLYTSAPVANLLFRANLHLDDIFQDQTADATQIYTYADHRIGKRSIVPAARSLA